MINVIQYTQHSNEEDKGTADRLHSARRPIHPRVIRVVEKTRARSPYMIAKDEYQPISGDLRKRVQTSSS